MFLTDLRSRESLVDWLCGWDRRTEGRKDRVGWGCITQVLSLRVQAHAQGEELAEARPLLRLLRELPHLCCWGTLR